MDQLKFYDTYGSTIRYIEPEDQCQECGGSLIDCTKDAIIFTMSSGRKEQIFVDRRCVEIMFDALNKAWKH